MYSVFGKHYLICFWQQPLEQDFCYLHLMDSREEEKLKNLRRTEQPLFCIEIQAEI